MKKVIFAIIIATSLSSCEKLGICPKYKLVNTFTGEITAQHYCGNANNHQFKDQYGNDLMVIGRN